MNNRHVREVVDLVAGIIATDDEFHPDELRFLLKVFKRFGIAESGDTEVVRPTKRSGEAAKAMRELPPELQQEAMTLLIDCAIADGKVVLAERNFLLAVARAAGVDESDLDARVNKALEDAKR